MCPIIPLSCSISRSEGENDCLFAQKRTQQPEEPLEPQNIEKKNELKRNVKIFKVVAPYDALLVEGGEKMTSKVNSTAQKISKVLLTGNEYRIIDII